MKYCKDCKIEVNGILYNDLVEPNIFICEDCGQFIDKEPTLAEKDFIDTIAGFGSWLVNNHEDVFSGGELQISKLCSDYVEHKQNAKELT